MTAIPNLSAVLPSVDELLPGLSDRNKKYLLSNASAASSAVAAVFDDKKTKPVSEVGELLLSAAHGSPSLSPSKLKSTDLPPVAAPAPSPSSPPSRPSITFDDIRLVRLLLLALDDKDGEHCGLVRVVRTGETGGDGRCAWVCREQAGGGHSACYDKYMSEGKACLLLDPLYQ